MSAVARGAPTSALRSSSTVCLLTFCSSSDSAAIRAYQSPLWRQVPHDPSIIGVCARKRYQALSLLACKARGFAPPPPFLPPPSLLNNASRIVLSLLGLIVETTMVGNCAGEALFFALEYAESGQPPSNERVRTTGQASVRERVIEEMLKPERRRRVEDHILHNVRRRCLDKPVSDGEVQDYILQMSNDREWFTHLEFELAADAFRRPIQVWNAATDGSLIKGSGIAMGVYDSAPLNVLYVHGNHYKAVVFQTQTPPPLPPPRWLPPPPPPPRWLPAHASAPQLAAASQPPAVLGAQGAAQLPGQPGQPPAAWPPAKKHALPPPQAQPSAPQPATDVVDAASAQPKPAATAASTWREVPVRDAAPAPKKQKLEPKLPLANRFKILLKDPMAATCAPATATAKPTAKPAAVTSAAATKTTLPPTKITATAGHAASAGAAAAAASTAMAVALTAAKRSLLPLPPKTTAKAAAASSTAPAAAATATAPAAAVALAPALVAAAAAANTTVPATTTAATWPLAARSAAGQRRAQAPAVSRRRSDRYFCCLHGKTHASQTGNKYAKKRSMYLTTECPRSFYNDHHPHIGFVFSMEQRDNENWLYSNMIVNMPRGTALPAPPPNGGRAFCGFVCLQKYEECSTLHNHRPASRPHRAERLPADIAMENEQSEPTAGEKLQLAVLASSGYQISAAATHAPSDKEAVKKSIRDHVEVTLEEKAKLVEAAKRRLGDALSSCTCGGCGIREVQPADGTCKWQKVSLGHLPHFFKLTEDELSAREALGSVQQVKEDGSMENIDAREFVNSYLCPTLNIRYHLLANFVERDGVWLCGDCNKGIAKGEPNVVSLAGGTDFGKLMPHSLTTFEKLLLADVRLYNIVIKVTHSGLGAGSIRRALKGHVVSFMQDGPTTAAGGLRDANALVADLTKALRVVFVGENGQRDRLASRLREPTGELGVRPWVIWNALMLRKALSPRHRDLDVPSLEELGWSLPQIQAAFVEAALQQPTDKAAFSSVQTHVDDVMAADVAQARAPLADDEVADDGVVLTHVAIIQGGTSVQAGLAASLSAIGKAVVDAGLTAHPQGAVVVPPPAAVLPAAVLPQAAMPPHAAPLPDAPPPPAATLHPAATPPTAAGEVRVARESEPLCEYTQNDVIIEGAFWWLFLTGKALGGAKGEKGILSPKRTRHMMLFYDRRCMDPQLLFALANQTMRAQCTRAVNASWRNHPNLAAEMEKLRQKADLGDKMAEALKNPNGSAAREIMRTLLPMLNISGNKVAWSRLERMSEISKLIAEVRWYGLPSIFLTFSPHDIMNQHVIRVCITPVDNTSFPATPHGFQQFLWGMETGSNTPVHLADFPVDMCMRELRKRGAADPAATSEMFRLITDMVVEVLIGLKPASAQRKTVPVMQRRKGVFGTPVAYSQMIEVSGRLALHGHAIFFGGPTTALLLAIAEDAELRASFSAALDTLVKSTLSDEVHFLIAAQGALKFPTQPANWMPSTPSPVQHPADYCVRTNLTAVTCQPHSHCGRCIKTPLGEKGCASVFARPHPVPCTRIKQLLPPVAEAKELPPQQVEDIDALVATLSQSHENAQNPYPDDSYCSLSCPHHKRKGKVITPISSLQPGGAEDDGRFFPKDTRVLAIEHERGKVNLAGLGDVRGTLSPDEALRLFREAVQMASMLEYLDSEYVARAFRERLERVTAEEAVTIVTAWRKLSCANANVAEYNDVLTNVLCCNNAVYFMGAGESARAAVYYLVKYITKDSVELQQALPLFSDALKHCQQYKSRAENEGTKERDAMFWAQRIINSLTGTTMELSDTQAAALLLGCSSSVHTNSFRYYYWKTIMEAAEGGVAVDDEGDEASDGEGSETSDVEDCDLDEDDFEPDRVSATKDMGEEEEETHSPGIAHRYHFTDGQGNEETVFVPPSDHYKFRGPGLSALSPVEYFMGVSITKKKEDSPEDASDGEPDGEPQDGVAQNRGGGRPCNDTWEFHEDHPLHGIYEQHAKSMYPLNIFAQGPPPKQPPGLKLASGAPVRPTAAWRRKAAQYARFILSNFKEWDVNQKPDLSVRALRNWIAELKEDAQHSTNTARRERARGRLFIITNFSHGLAVDKRAHFLTKKDRMRDRDLWENVPKPGAPSKKETDAGDGLEDYRKELDKLRKAAELREFDPRRVKEAFAKADFLERLVRDLQSLYGETTHQRDDAVAAAAAKAALGCVPSGQGALDVSDDKGAAVLQSILEPRPPLLRTVLPQSVQQRLEDALREHTTSGSFVLPELEPITEDEFDVRSAHWRQQEQLFLQGRGPHPGHPVLTPAQRTLGRIVVADLLRVLAHERTGASRRDCCQKQLAPVLMLLGQGGTGKSVFWAELKRLMDENGLGVAYGTAYMGVASAPLGGATLCSSLGLNGEDTTKKTFSEVDVSEVVKLREAFMTFTGFATAEDMLRLLKVIYIDECSQFTAAFLAQVSHRLQIIMDCNLPFGGLKVILAGDFLQKKPPIGEAMFERLVAIDVLGKFPPSPGSPECEGLQLLRDFKRIDFTRAMRTSDPKLLTTLAELRDLKTPHPVQIRTIPPQLTSAEVQADANWMFATIGVVSNPERIRFNYEQALKWARFFDVPLVRWPLELTGKIAESLSPAEHALVYENELAAWGYFVLGGPVGLTENVPRGNKGIVNGGRGTAHSLSWFGKQRSVAEEASMLVNVKGFQVVTLNDYQRPTTYNVLLSRDENAFEWENSDSLVDGLPVVPIPVSSHADKLLLISPECAIRGLPKVLSVKDHSVSLAFALTDFKIQGLSLRYLILSLSQRSTRPFHDMHGYYVFESRVRTFDGLRRLPSRMSECTHLTRLAYSDNLKRFYAGWVPDRDEALAGLSCWSPEAAKAGPLEDRPPAPKRKADGDVIAAMKRAKTLTEEALQRPGVAQRLCTTTTRPVRVTPPVSIIPLGRKRTPPPSQAVPLSPQQSPSIIPVPTPRELVRDLTRWEHRALQNFFRLNQLQIAFTSHQRAELIKADMQRLRCLPSNSPSSPLSYQLNDEIINALRVLINEDKRALARESFYIITSLAVESARKGLALRNITQPDGMRDIAVHLAPRNVGSVYLLDKDLLLLPFHSPGHWALVVADLRDYSLSLLDSLPGHTTTNWAVIAQHIIRSHGSSVTNDVRQASERATELAMASPHDERLAESARKAAVRYNRAQHVAADDCHWTERTVPVPQQCNGIDCGVFMMALSLCVTRRMDVFCFEQDDIATLRQLFALSLHEKKLVF